MEDHGYLLDLGVPEVSGFLAFKDLQSDKSAKLRVGQLLNATVSSVSKNGRTCNVTIDTRMFVTSSVSDLDSETGV